MPQAKPAAIFLEGGEQKKPIFAALQKYIKKDEGGEE